MHVSRCIRTVLCGCDHTNTIFHHPNLCITASLHASGAIGASDPVNMEEVNAFVGTVTCVKSFSSSGLIKTEVNRCRM